MLSEKEKEELMTITRITLATYLKERRIPTFDPRSGTLLKPGGAFVTLREGKNLRGCIGNFESLTPLYLTVQKMAILAATQDPRFFAVNERELPEIEIEISVISPRRGIERLSEIEVGKHGLSIEKEECRGVLLPQVASDNHWNREEFLSHTCLKAGLPPDAWEQGGLKIEVFTAEVFSERHNSPSSPS